MKIVREVGTYEAKTNLSKLLDEVEEGKSIKITRHGKVVAELTPPAKEKKKAKRGCAKSKNFYMAEDFDAPLDDFKEYM